MTRSMFDPTSNDRLDEGGRYTGRSAEDESHLPPSATDGVARDDPDVKVPLQGTETTGLDPADTEKLTEAASDAIQEELQSPDDITAPTSRGDPGEKRDDKTWMEDTSFGAIRAARSYPPRG